MFERLLICTDFTDGMQRLARFVPALAETGAQQITFLHSVPFEGGEIPREDTDQMEWARAQLEIALEQAPSGVEVLVEVESGSKPSDAIARLARERQVDLILLGAPIRNVLTERLFGSTTVALCQKIAVPILILRPQLISTYTAEELELRCRHLVRYLLIPYDDSDPSKYLIQKMKQMVEPKNHTALQQCHLCWVVDDVRRRGLPSNEAEIAMANTTLSGVKAELESVGLKVEPVEVRKGEAVAEVLTAAEMTDVSAIAVASDDISGRFLQFSPSFTMDLLRRSWYPILYFPLPK